MARVYEKLRSQVLPRELEDIGLESTPQYDPYENETQNKQTFSKVAKELEPMSEVRNHYIGAEILLSKENKMAIGHIVAHSHDASGNIMGRTQANPVLDTKIYQVQFTGGEVTE